MRYKLPFPDVYLLTDNDHHARLDRDALRSFAPRSVKIITGGAMALDHLRVARNVLALLDSRLEDMDGVEFLRRLHKEIPLFKGTVIMVTAENRREKVLDAIAAGCGGYILRPYSQVTFERHLRAARRLEQFAEIEELQVEEAKTLAEAGDLDEAVEAYEEAVLEQEEARRYYDMGMAYLVDAKYGKAIIAFKRALKINNLYAEAYRGLADAYKRKGDESKALEFMQKAAEVYAEFDRMEETKELFIAILKMEDKAINPFNTLGVRLRRQGDYEGALRAYERALELAPDDERLYFNMAKALCYLGESRTALQRLRQALRMNANFAEARVLFKEITGREWDAAQAARQQPERTSTSLLDG